MSRRKASDISGIIYHELGPKPAKPKENGGLTRLIIVWARGLESNNAV